MRYGPQRSHKAPRASDGPFRILADKRQLKRVKPWTPIYGCDVFDFHLSLVQVAFGAQRLCHNIAAREVIDAMILRRVKIAMTHDSLWPRSHPAVKASMGTTAACLKPTSALGAGAAGLCLGPVRRPQSRMKETLENSASGGCRWSGLRWKERALGGTKHAVSQYESLTGHAFSSRRRNSTVTAMAKWGPSYWRKNDWHSGVEIQ